MSIQLTFLFQTQAEFSKQTNAFVHRNSKGGKFKIFVASYTCETKFANEGCNHS